MTHHESRETGPRVTVIIPNWNGKELLRECLTSLKNITYVNYKIIVVDNGSQDDSYSFIKEQYPEIILIRFPVNKGFSVAVNEGIKQSNSPYIALLNNDVIVDKSWLGELVRVIEHNTEVYSCASRILFYNDRRHINSAGDEFSTYGFGFNRGWGEEDILYNKQDNVFSSSACAALYSRSIIKELGYFDEELVSYFEDVDLGFRAQLKGYKCMYVPSSIVYHKVGATSERIFHQIQVLTARNRVLVLVKNLPTPLWIRMIHRIIFSTVIYMTKSIIRGTFVSHMKGLIEAVMAIPLFLQKRKMVQAGAKIDYRDLKKKFFNQKPYNIKIL